MPADQELLFSQFQEAFGRPPALISEAPGRVNLIGEHTDYNGGFVLPMAIDRTVAVAASPRDGSTVRAISLDFGQRDEFPADAVRRFLGTRGGWRDYVRGVAWALTEEHIPLRGADIAICGDVPRGAGLSSSAAVEVAVAGALLAIAGAEVTPRDIALACQKAENLFVGVQCGVMDQFASALGRAGYALLIDCRSLEFEHVPLPGGVAVVVVDSKIPRDLAATPYNERRRECEEAAAALGLPSLRDATEAMLVRLGAPLQARVRHVLSENTRVLAMIEALGAADAEAAGRLLLESHASLRDDFRVSTPEIDALVEIAVAAGAYGARVTGAGFGGCTVNLVPAERTGGFLQTVAAEYHRRTGLSADAYICAAANGLRVTRCPT